MKNNDLVSYSDSSIKHFFDLDVDHKHKEKLLKLINKELSNYKGFVELSSNYIRIYSAVYETTNSDEFDVDTAEAISKAINDAIKKLTIAHCGFEAICE